MPTRIVTVDGIYRVRVSDVPIIYFIDAFTKAGVSVVEKPGDIAQLPTRLR